MRVLILVFALAGCSSFPVNEFRQSLGERASGVVYAVAEPAVPEYSVPRPAARPDNLLTVAVAAPRNLSVQNPLTVAEQYLGFTETNNRKELRQFMGVDPRVTEWCAAFVNSVLDTIGQPGSETVSRHPLLARSFTDWGTPVDHKRETPEPGDVVVFPRGRQSWQGHVGFYVDTVTIDGKQYWQILGGNQKNSVSIDLYSPSRAIAVRRAPIPIIEARGFFHRLRSWLT